MDGVKIALVQSGKLHTRPAAVEGHWASKPDEAFPALIPQVALSGARSPQGITCTVLAAPDPKSSQRLSCSW